MKDRIKQIMESKHMTQQVFAQFIDMSPASLSSIFNGRTKPTLNIVEAIKRKFLTSIQTGFCLVSATCTSTCLMTGELMTQVNALHLKHWPWILGIVIFIPLPNSRSTTEIYSQGSNITMVCRIHARR